MAHIPQPDANSELPGQQLSALDGLMPQPSIELPASNPNDILHVGQDIPFETYLKVHSRRLTSLRWNVLQPEGTLLWYIPLSPLNLDATTSEYALNFLAWAGDFSFNFKIAGTGFHAGMVTFVHLPPTIHPSEVTNPKDFSILPWTGADPKLLEIVTHESFDIRPIMYHYTRKTPNMPEDYTIGGYLAVFTDLPLATSSTGNNEISVGVWVKLGMNFKFRFPIPRKLATGITTAQPPAFYQELLNFSGHKTPILASVPTYATIMQIQPSSIKVFNSWLYNCFGLNGIGLSKHDSGRYLPPLLTSKIKKVTITDKQIGFTALELDLCWPIACSMGTIIPKTDDKCDMVFSGSLSVNTKWEYTLSPKEGCDPTGKFSGDTAIAFYGLQAPAEPPLDNEYSLPATGESIIQFCATDFGLKSAQLARLASYYETGALDPWIPGGSAAVFQCIDVPTSLPIFFVKLYRNGLMTTTARDSQVDLAIDRLKLEFYSMIPETAPIPGGTVVKDMAKNLVLAQIDDYSRMKKMKAKSRFLEQRSSPKRSTKKYGRTSSISSSGSK